MRICALEGVHRHRDVDAVLRHAAQALKSMPEEGRDAAERKVKLRTLGNIRLISELYKQDVVSEKILHACIQEMLGDGKSEPFEEDVEVRCQVVRAQIETRQPHASQSCLPSAQAPRGIPNCSTGNQVVRPEQANLGHHQAEHVMPSIGHMPKRDACPALALELMMLKRWCRAWGCRRCARC